MISTNVGHLGNNLQSLRYFSVNNVGYSVFQISNENADILIQHLISLSYSFVMYTDFCLRYMPFPEANIAIQWKNHLLKKNWSFNFI